MSKYMPDAEHIARHSKDPSTQVGAIIIGRRGEHRASGWNGAARGCKADEDERFTQRPEKLFWAVHAEANAIANAAAVGTPLEGTTMVVTHFPCMACANLIVQAGIKKVITKKPTPDFVDRWADQIARSIRLFSECDVALEILE